MGGPECGMGTLTHSWTPQRVGRHHRLNGHECEQTPGVGDGQGGLACCSELNLRDRVLGEVKTNSFIGLPKEESRIWLKPSKLCAPAWRGRQEFHSNGSKSGRGSAHARASDWLMVR